MLHPQDVLWDSAVCHFNLAYNRILYTPNQAALDHIQNVFVQTSFDFRDYAKYLPTVGSVSKLFDGHRPRKYCKISIEIHELHDLTFRPFEYWSWFETDPLYLGCLVGFETVEITWQIWDGPTFGYMRSQEEIIDHERIFCHAIIRPLSKRLGRESLRHEAGRWRATFHPREDQATEQRRLCRKA